MWRTVLKSPAAAFKEQEIISVSSCYAVLIEYSLTTMMRIAIAGSGGLAQHFARFINDTSHPFIILSRAVSSSND
jgi:hypothetical protein